jgi:hypothetical protein
MFSSAGRSSFTVDKIDQIPDAIKQSMKLNFVDSMDEVLKIALERELVALPMPPASVEVLPSDEAVAH